MAKKDSIIVGLDIGTTKVCVIVGEAKGDGVEIIGIGTHPSRGLRKGVVINIDSTVESIRKAVEEAELMAGCEIKSVYAGISGGHVRTFNSQGAIAVKEGEIRQDDIDRAVEAAQAVAIPTDRRIVHVIPQEYIVDGHGGIQEPLGMSGIRLAVEVHIVTASITAAQNIIKCANRAGLDVGDIVLQQVASSEAVLAQDEKDLGVALVDVGGGTTDVAVFHGGTIKYTSVLSLGGNQVTGDVAVGLRTPAGEAEKIKKNYGCAMVSMVDEGETIEVPGVGGRKPRKVSRHLVSEIIEPRMEELFELTKRELAKSGYDGLTPSGVVLTGGTAAMEGAVELAEQVFSLPARRGMPTNITGFVDVVSSPAYATGVGLVRYGIRHSCAMGLAGGGKTSLDRALRSIKRWFREFF